MSTNQILEKKILHLINQFNSKNYDSVITQAKEIINSNSNNPVIYNLLGASYSLVNNHLLAITAYQNAHKLDSNNEEILRNMGKSYSWLEEDEKAYECFSKACKIKSKNADAIFNIGLLSLKKKQFQDSVIKFKLAIEYNKNLFQAFYNLGIVQNKIGNFCEAQNSYLEAIKINKNYYQAYNNLGSILIKLNKTHDAIIVLEKALEIKPKYIEAFTNLGVAYLQIKKYREALRYFNNALLINPLHVSSISQKLYLMRKICDWSEDNILEKNINLINNSKADVTPWQLLSLDDDPNIELIRAKRYGYQFDFKDFNSIYKNSKIKLAYFTPDFYEHAGMFNMEGIFKYHDKNKFEIYAFDYGNFHNDSTHQKIKKYFDHFIYIEKLSDDEVTKIVEEYKIDIVIHRNGYSQNSRNSLFAKKIAPLQISFLGYPGTMGVKFIDYIIADEIVIPNENRKFFTEKIIYMPNSYYPTNNERKISSIKYNKKDFNIPDDAFVFGSFNNSYKISSKEFLIWMKLLAKIKNSYLILLISDDLTKENLIKEIIKQNEDPDRVKFLNFINNEEHLARHQLIDLYLDTFNYNGHTSTVDALYTGIPVVTKKGKSFTSRVCASILTAINMHELITNTEEEYFNLVLEIASKKQNYKRLKRDLKLNLKTTKLFNTKKYVQNLERGYQIAFENKIKLNKVQDVKV